MASTDTLPGIRAAIKATLEGEIDGLHVYEKVPDKVAHLPCVIVSPMQGDMTVDFEGHCVIWTFTLVVLASRAEVTVGQDYLDGLVDSHGDQSIKHAVLHNQGLGIDVTSVVTKMTEYGREFTIGGIPYIGAKLHLKVCCGT